MYLSAMIINTVAISFPFISMIVYARLLAAIFWFKTIKKAPDLSLFYYKFGLDLVISVVSLNKLTMYALVMTSLSDFFMRNHHLTFIVLMPINLLTAMRGILLFFIALDRIFATYFPIAFFKYRKLIPTFSIICIVFLYSFIDLYIAFFHCLPNLNLPTTCVNNQCVLGDCYQNYALAFQEVCYALISFLTLLLAIKLFIWNKYKKQTVSSDLKRANRLALIDCGIIVIFDLIPPIIHTMYPGFFDYIGAINSVAQTLGFVVESYLCTISVQQKYQTKVGSSTAMRSGHFMETSVVKQI